VLFFRRLTAVPGWQQLDPTTGPTGPTATTTRCTTSSTGPTPSPSSPPSPRRFSPGRRAAVWPGTGPAPTPRPWPMRSGPVSVSPTGGECMWGTGWPPGRWSRPWATTATPPAATCTSGSMTVAGTPTGVLPGGPRRGPGV